MAVRSEAGTGVIVSLVVFVLTTVFLLVLTIVFYAGQTDALEQEAKARADLARYVKAHERNQDFINRIESRAAQSNESVAMYLHKQYADLMGYVSGQKGTTFEKLRTDASRYGVEDDAAIMYRLEDLHRTVRDRDNELERLNEKLADREEEIAEFTAQLDQARIDHANEVEAVRGEILAYKEAGDQYREEVEQVKDRYDTAIDRHREQYEGRINELETANEAMDQELVVLRGRVNEMEARLDRTRIKAKAPESLVDGRIIDIAANDQVFINRGRKHRVVLGMTFEVYDDAASIRVDQVTGEVPRGKGSLQVIKVGDTTSTCKITRSTRGRPVVREDVIANAVYDPEYRFKFLVHGKFDVDFDGRPSNTEAEYLRSLIVEWGGEVLRGDELTGDLDFLVLGVEPPMPPRLRLDASAIMIEDWSRKRQAALKYDELFRQGREAQIPVLNANRFFILIGHTER
ncbi:MAG: HlyD family secretion protein [Planctomycetota bacterium]|jgi:cbb3-type cytochrome oxidase subunit 3